ncbi:MAG: hypothetical protein ACOC0P_04315 [Planctomycetota bacterium]
MQDQLVTVFRGRTVEDAQAVADRLTQSGIEAFVESTVSPMYGAPVGPRGKIVQVRAPAQSAAQPVIEDFEANVHRGLTQEEWELEEAGGYEEATDDRPSAADAPQNFNVDNERLSDSGPSPEAPELAGTVDPDDPHRTTGDQRIASFHPDRGEHADPVIERDEIQEKPIDELDPDEDMEK